MVYGPIGPVIMKLSIIRSEWSTVFVVYTSVHVHWELSGPKSISCFVVNLILPKIVLPTRWLVDTRHNFLLWQTCASHP